MTTTTNNARGPKGVKYTVTHQDASGNVKAKVSWTFFDKAKIQAFFDQCVEQSKTGDTVEFMKETKTNFYPSMLYVENLDGKAYVYDSKGRRKEYKRK